MVNVQLLVPMIVTAFSIDVPRSRFGRLIDTIQNNSFCFAPHCFRREVFENTERIYYSYMAQ